MRRHSSSCLPMSVHLILFHFHWKKIPLCMLPLACGPHGFDRLTHFFLFFYLHNYYFSHTAFNTDTDRKLYIPSWTSASFTWLHLPSFALSFCLLKGKLFTTELKKQPTALLLMYKKKMVISTILLIGHFQSPTPIWQKTGQGVAALFQGFQGEVKPNIQVKVN